VTDSEALSIRGLRKSFGGIHALLDVDLDIQAGEVHGLLGENGSGKSTLIKVLAGFYAPDSGTLSAWGEDVPLPVAPGRFREWGMEFVHQDLGLIPSLTVVENLIMGRLSAHRGATPISWKRERELAQRVLAKYGVSLDVTARVAELQSVEQALLAIVRGVEDMRVALARTGRTRGVLFLDEPTAFLPRDQVDQLFDLIRRIVSSGASVVLVSHDLDEVCRITDRITVLRNGRNVGTVHTGETDVAGLTQMIIGRELAESEPIEHRDAAAREPVLAVDELSGPSLRDVSLELHEGEVLGITGLVGSGFEELPYLVFGSSAATTGHVRLFGETGEASRRTPGRSIAAGIALIPGDRQHDGSIGSLSLTENLMQLSLRTYFRRGLLRRAALRKDARTLMDEYDVRPREPELSYGSFSGGNQQKALMAKWLHQHPRILLVHEPTQGVDVGARQTIHHMIREAATRGTAVICASSDYEQMAAICDRVLIFAQGRVYRELTGVAVTKDNITEQCLVSLASRPVAAREEVEA
jgi:ribose transport system ATP-binding protein